MLISRVSYGVKIGLSFRLFQDSFFLLPAMKCGLSQAFFIEEEIEAEILGILFPHIPNFKPGLWKTRFDTDEADRYFHWLYRQA